MEQGDFMRTTPLILSTALLLAAACTPAPGGQDTPTEHSLAKVAVAPPEGGFIDTVDYMGTGCDETTATSAFSPDKQVVTSGFSGFIAAAGPGEDPALTKRNCLIMMKISVPQGWSYSLESVDYRGFAGLDRNVTASRKSFYLISGSPVHSTPAASFRGEISDDYTHPDVGPAAPGPWSPCGGGQILWVVTQTEVSNARHEDRFGQLTVDTIDTELLWRRCE
jgi:hypothetical protein